MKARNIIKKDNTYYSDFRIKNGKRIRRSLGKDLIQAKIKVLQLMADVDVQSEQVGRVTSKPKSKSYLAALNEYIESIYAVVNANSSPVVMDIE